MPITLRQFFDRYAELSSEPDPERLADLYAPTFIVGGPEGSQAFANDSRFLEWLREANDFNRRHGMRWLGVVAIHAITLSPLHTLATVSWGAQFEKTGARIIEFEISYLVEHAGESWKILSYISQTDQNAEMKKAGLL